jgi:FkbM family methyltransferase
MNFSKLIQAARSKEIKIIFKKLPKIFIFISSLNAIRSYKNFANKIDIDIKLTLRKIKVEKIGNNKIIYISQSHRVYLPDVVNSFSYYFNAVDAKSLNRKLVVDYSKPRFHKVKGFPDFPIFFPSLAEPIETVEQYLGFAKLQEGHVVIDLGAYSGLTSIIFKKNVGKNGKVIAVEADKHNLKAVKINLRKFNEVFSEEILIADVAIWNDNNGAFFTSEGNMGSSVTEYIGERTHKKNFVKTMTLSSLAELFELKKVDFLKVDIEGGEYKIFEDYEFLNKYQPKIIVEPHPVNGVLSTCKVTSDLRNCGYIVKQIVQNGVVLPLLECSPNI